MFVARLERDPARTFASNPHNRRILGLIALAAMWAASAHASEIVLRKAGSAGSTNLVRNGSFSEIQGSAAAASRDDCYLEIPVAMQQSFQDAAQSCEVLFARYEAFGFEFSPMNCVQGFPDVARRMMKICLDRNLGIMNERAVQGDVRAGRAAAEEIDGSPAAHHAHRLLPRFF